MVNLIQIWVANNRLFINYAKTKIMIVNPRNWCKSIAKMTHVQFGPYSVEIVRDFKLLGEHLTFQKMADETKRKINYRLYGLSSLYYMPVHTKTHLFKVFVLPHFDYILLLSAYWTAGIVDQLEKVYNRALKQTLNMTVKFMDREAQLKCLSLFNIMPFHHRRLYRLSLCVHRFLYSDYLPAVSQQKLVLEQQ
jgi:hypothetical protein